MSGSSDAPVESIKSFSTSALRFGSQSWFSESPTFLYNRDPLIPGINATEEQHDGSGGANGSSVSHGSKRTPPYISLPSPSDSSRNETGQKYLPKNSPARLTARRPHRRHQSKRCPR